MLTFHHAGLFQSLILLFENRLDFNIYRPIGTEWYDEGFWAVYDHPATVQQFLSIGSATPDNTPPLNKVESKAGYIYHCHDIQSDKTNKAITLEGFKNTDFTLVIASIPQHIPRFRKLIDAYKPNAKLIFQIGNAWNISPEQEDMIDGVMASAIVGVPDGFSKPIISYHQEFDLKVFYPDVELQPDKKISSFVNCFDDKHMFADDYELFLKMEKLMPDYSFRAYGGQCRDGVAQGVSSVADEMRSSMFLWHTKRGGDGYGHILFNSAAVGRPAIVKKEYYVGKLGDKLLIPDEICISIDGLNPAQIREKITFYSQPEIYNKMRTRIVENFYKSVSFEDDAQKVKQLISKLL